MCALPNGALVLPALDQSLDEESWVSIADHPEHPQFGLKKLIEALGLSRRDVEPLGGPEQTPARRARWSLACEAMRPAGTTERWHRFAAAAEQEGHGGGAGGPQRGVEAATAEEEAEAIVPHPARGGGDAGRTAMPIAPDRCAGAAGGGAAGGVEVGRR